MFRTRPLVLLVTGVLVVAACSATAPENTSTTAPAAGSAGSRSSAGGSPGTTVGRAQPPGSPDSTVSSSVPGSDASPTTGPLPEPTVVASGLNVPWGIAFLPGGDALISERDSGQILRMKPGQSPQPVMTLTNARPTQEGGLLGLAVSPTYDQDQLVFAYYTTDTDNRITRFKLGEREEVIVSGINKAVFHDGGRLAFGPDGMLYATTGDATRKDDAQNLDSLNGKILRMRPDGSAPPDNPFAGSLVYSYGHRNVQGIAWDGAGRLWASEFGQNALDELNLISPGGNYGWPAAEGPDTSGSGKYIDPKVWWKTTEASPSGIAYWRDALYLGALMGQRLWRVPLDAQGNTGKPEGLLSGTYGRLRVVIAAPDGSLWVGTSNTDGRGQPNSGDDRILRFAAS